MLITSLNYVTGEEYTVAQCDLCSKTVEPNEVYFRFYCDRKGLIFQKEKREDCNVFICASCSISKTDEILKRYFDENKKAICIYPDKKAYRMTESTIKHCNLPHILGFDEQPFYDTRSTIVDMKRVTQ